MTHSALCHDGTRTTRDSPLTEAAPAAAVSHPEPVATPGLAGPGLAQSRIPVSTSLPSTVLARRKPLARPSQIPVASEGKDGAGGPRQTSPVLDVVGKGGGEPLAPDVRADMEHQLGADFSDVRIHTGDQAAKSAVAISAEAYTVGHEVVFGHRSFSPASSEGRHRLGHELTHVLQQRKGPVPGTNTGKGVSVSDPSDSFEQEAEATANRLVYGPRPVAGNGPTGGPQGGPQAQRPGLPSVQRYADMVQRQDAPERTLSFPPDVIYGKPHFPPRPRASDASAYVTVADTIKNDYMRAALQGTLQAQSAVGAGFDWTAWATNLIGNTIWAAACFVPVAAGPAVIFGVSMLGVGVAAVGALPKSQAEFGSFASDNLSRLEAEFDKQKGFAGDRAFALATSNNWDDNQTRLEMHKSLLSPEFINIGADGMPSVNHDMVVAAVERDMLLKAGQTPLSAGAETSMRAGGAYSGSPSFQLLVEDAIRNVGRIEYVYNVDGTTASAGGITGFFGARNATPPSGWSFHLKRVHVLMRSEVAAELTRTLSKLYENGPVPIATLKIPKVIQIIEGTDITSQADTPEVEVNDSNKVARVHAVERYRDYLKEKGQDDTSYGEEIVHRAWASSMDQPPPAVLTVESP